MKEMIEEWQKRSRRKRTRCKKMARMPSFFRMFSEHIQIKGKRRHLLAGSLTHSLVAMEKQKYATWQQFTVSNEFVFAAIYIYIYIKKNNIYTATGICRDIFIWSYI